MGTANTAWKLTNMWNASLFTFDLTNGWHPTNENQTPELTGEMYNIPWDNLVQKFDYGLGGRQIALQGVDVSNEDMWLLSSTVCKRQLMKLWVGEDWFYYVLGQEPRQIRDQSLPYQKSYLVSFIAVDPHYYYAQSAQGGTDATKEQVGPTTLINAAWSGSPSTANITVESSTSGSQRGTLDAEACYWIIGGTSTAITKVTLYDLQKRQIEYTPQTTIENGHVHVIMPYRNTMVEGFVVNDITGFRVRDGTGSLLVTEPEGTVGGSVTARGTWAMDAFSIGAGTEISSIANYNTYYGVYEEVPCIPSLRSGSIFTPRSRYYPPVVNGESKNHRVEVAGTATDAKVFAQFCERRV